ncbi:hypothetical protein PRIPAC_92710 [Pristionchus pacificus]|uniref:Uncharacterized protein n=1 Tax=Pristionchus pacificus TaxID=54126 RepID=A0A2A6C9G9_PRIPA|nr:hypothetical protein PRIPAC_92710 [Pristionchus pacificus]|eukprot:PDM74730.1 hypothetical protein PRIPAC_43681 [Pristionchus pacificus]
MAATTRRRRFAFVALTTALAALTLAHQVATVTGAVAAERSVFEDEDHFFGCIPDRPAGIASVGFVAGAFFALCFQCRD